MEHAAGRRRTRRRLPQHPDREPCSFEEDVRDWNGPVGKGNRVCTLDYPRGWFADVPPSQIPTAWRQLGQAAM